MKFLVIPCFYLLFLFLAGCDTNDAKGKLVAPATGRIESNKADGDGIVVKAKGDPDADEVLKGDPDGTGNEAQRMGLGKNMDGTPIQLGDPTADD